MDKLNPKLQDIKVIPVGEDLSVPSLDKNTTVPVSDNSSNSTAPEVIQSDVERQTITNSTITPTDVNTTEAADENLNLFFPTEDSPEEIQQEVVEPIDQVVDVVPLPIQEPPFNWLSGDSYKRFFVHLWQTIRDDFNAAVLKFKSLFTSNQPSLPA